MIRYTQPDILDLVPDLNPKLLRMWIIRGFVEVEDKNPGRGKSRQYTWPEVAYINAMTALSFNGRGPSENMQIAKLVKKRAEDAVKNSLFPLESIKDILTWWTPQGIDDGLDRCFLIYKFTKDGILQRHKFVKYQDINHKTLWYEGSFFDCDYMLQRMAETLLDSMERKKMN